MYIVLLYFDSVVLFKVLLPGSASLIDSRPDQSVAGDVIVLTKPLGTQIAVNAHQWVNGGTEKFLSKIRHIVTDEQGFAHTHMHVHTRTTHTHTHTHTRTHTHTHTHNGSALACVYVFPILCPLPTSPLIILVTLPVSCSG